eukprot:TRINITY_DN2382_c0_g2_i2.p1 TRINITY_DN2382_c0_g2~~TRINITY_DN2382_c0_g2_i2.p1  ORF type:complete len:587 (+),score=149.84 TRINITY_DN2382_c0_g2_i2:248-2008(+)
MGRGHTHLLSSSSLLLSVFLLIALEHVHEIEAGAVSTSVFERNLVTDKVDYRSILAENDRYWVNTSHRHFTGSVLGYVTPWNGKGYDIAKTFRAKFTHISPVWYQLRNGDNGGLVLTGSHDVDAGWIEAVRVNGLPRIVPRVVLEMDEVQKLLTQKSKQKTAIRLIVDECKLRGYDGIVFEAWFTWMAAQALESPDLRNKALLFLEQLGKALHATPVTHNSTTSSSAATSPRHLQLIFVIPPPHPKAGAIAFTNEDLTRLDPYLDGVSLMTYDFSNAHRPGFSAPITWVKSVLKFLLPSVKPKFGEWVYPTLYETDVEKEAEGEEDKKAEEAEKKRGEKEARVEEEEEEEEWEDEEWEEDEIVSNAFLASLDEEDYESESDGREGVDDQEEVRRERMEQEEEEEDEELEEGDKDGGEEDVVDEKEIWEDEEEDVEEEEGDKEARDYRRTVVKLKAGTEDVEEESELEDDEEEEEEDEDEEKGDEEGKEDERDEGVVIATVQGKRSGSTNPPKMSRYLAEVKVTRQRRMKALLRLRPVAARGVVRTIMPTPWSAYSNLFDLPEGSEEALKSSSSLSTIGNPSGASSR